MNKYDTKRDLTEQSSRFSPFMDGLLSTAIYANLEVLYCRSPIFIISSNNISVNIIHGY